MESLQNRFHDLSKEAELERQRKLHSAMAAASRVALIHGGCVYRPSLAPALTEAGRVLRLRLDTLLPAISGAASDDDFGARLDDLESAVTSFRTTVASERREHRLRIAAVAADRAVAERHEVQAAA